MEFSVCSFGFALIAIFLAVQVSEGKSVRSPGILDEMPKNCSNVDFCLEKHTDYPQEKIDLLLTKKYRLTLASTHEEPFDREGTGDDSENDCEKHITYGEIYEILDENDNVRVVVQSPKIFKQQLRIEQCVTPGRLLDAAATRNFDSEELRENEISCVEKKMDYNFLVLSKDGDGVESVRSKHGIPVCCSCRLSF